MEGEEEPVPGAPLLPSDVKYDEKKMLLHKLDRCGFNLQKSSLTCCCAVSPFCSIPSSSR